MDLVKETPKIFHMLNHILADYDIEDIRFERVDRLIQIKDDISVTISVNIDPNSARSFVSPTPYVQHTLHCYAHLFFRSIIFSMNL
ncbi:hypothetical protein L0244_24465 [bacterium]|nr:hypothetical protein [bacterium]